MHFFSLIKKEKFALKHILLVREEWPLITSGMSTLGTDIPGYCEKQHTQTLIECLRAHSLSGCANLDSTPVLLGGTGVYHQPQSHYCSWSWNWVCLLSCGLGWNPLLSTPFAIFLKADLQPVKIAILLAFLYWAWRKEEGEVTPLTKLHLPVHIFNPSPK